MKAHPGRLEVIHHLDAVQGLTQPAEIQAALKGFEEAEAYLCGPGPFMTLVESTLLAAGMPRVDETVRWVIGADTVVVVDDVIYGKPTDVQEAREMLQRLSGREHLVITGFCLFDLKRAREGLQAVTTVVKFKELTRTEIDAYVSVGESMDKAGSYAVQGVGSYLVEYLRGSYTNVVGLPLCQVIEMMEEMGARDVLPWGARETL